MPKKKKKKSKVRKKIKSIRKKIKSIRKKIIVESENELIIKISKAWSKQAYINKKIYEKKCTIRETQKSCALYL